MIRRTDRWATLVVVLAAAAVAVTLADVRSPARAAIVLAFVLVVPGLAIVRPIGLRDPLVELTLGVAVSVAIDTLAASAILYAGGWSPSLVLVVIVGLTLAATAGDAILERRRERRAT
jgi:uncharacterized membrane protein